MNIYPIIQFDIYIYIYNIRVFFIIIYCNIAETHTHTGHTGFTFT